MVEDLGAILGYDHHVLKPYASYPMFTFATLDSYRNSFFERLREL
jgi:hypothetical protein